LVILFSYPAACLEAVKSAHPLYRERILATSGDRGLKLVFVPRLSEQAPFQKVLFQDGKLLQGCDFCIRCSRSLGFSRLPCVEASLGKLMFRLRLLSLGSSSNSLY